MPRHWKIMKQNSLAKFRGEKRVLIQALDEGFGESHDTLASDTYSSFRLKTKFWMQNNKNFNNFGVTTDMIGMIGR